jgi:hypothetical protein
MTRHKIMEFCTEWFSVSPNINLKFRTIAVLKIFAMIETKLVGMFMIIHYTKHHLFECNIS